MFLSGFFDLIKRVSVVSLVWDIRLGVGCWKGLGMNPFFCCESLFFGGLWFVFWIVDDTLKWYLTCNVAVLFFFAAHISGSCFHTLVLFLRYNRTAGV